MYELWRDIVSFRKQFTELKGTTERDLTRVRNDLAQTGRSLTSACFGFLTVSKTAETQGQVEDHVDGTHDLFVSPRRQSSASVMIEPILRVKFERRHGKSPTSNNGRQW